MQCATIAIQNVDCILKLAVKDLKFHGPFIPVGEGLKRFIGLVDIHALHYWVMVPILELFDINFSFFYYYHKYDVRVCIKGFRNLACTTNASNLFLLPVYGAANLDFSSHIN